MIVAALLTAPLFLLAAKAHGRQVRLERENAGHHDITFGGTNPSFVEALWRRDRVAFWTLTPIAALVCVALLLALSVGGAWLLLAAPWGMIVGFLALGVASAARSRDAKVWLWAAAALALVTAVSVVALA